MREFGNDLDLWKMAVALLKGRVQAGGGVVGNLFIDVYRDYARLAA